MKNAILYLYIIITSRFFGLFIVLPVFSAYANQLENANEFLVGLLIGAYAITQAVFQLPFGVISDKIGRKKTLILGLVMFTIGSFICAYATDIYTMFAGRLLQGAGAIGSVVSAMISDNTKEENRSKAMATMGIMIGLTFSLAMALGPILSDKWGLKILFIISAYTSIACIALIFMMPKEIKISNREEKIPLSTLFKQKNLILLSSSIFLEKMLTSIVFLVVPIVLLKLGQTKLWPVYLSATFVGLLAAGYSGRTADKKGISKQILISGMFILGLSYLVFLLSDGIYLFAFGVVVFFIGFNLYESVAQATASKLIKRNQRGAALGLFNSFAYFGTFIGGLVGGLFLHNLSLNTLYIFCIILSLIWFSLLFKLEDPKYFKNLYFDKNLDINLDLLENKKGIIEYFTDHKEKVVKFNSKLINENDINRILNYKKQI